MVHIENLIVENLPQRGRRKLKLAGQVGQVPIQLSCKSQQFVALVGQGADDGTDAVRAKWLAGPQFGYQKVIQFAACGIVGTSQRKDVATQPIDQHGHIRGQIDGLGFGLGGKVKLFGKALFARQGMPTWSTPALLATGLSRWIPA